MSKSADDGRLRARPPLDSVLVATDFSSGAAAAAARSLELPLAVGARLSLLHVLPDALPERLRAGVEEPAARLRGKRVAKGESASSRRPGAGRLIGRGRGQRAWRNGDGADRSGPRCVSR